LASAAILPKWGCYTSPSEITSEIPMEVKGFEPPQEEDIPIHRSEKDTSSSRSFMSKCISGGA
ncbi:hypothetical protein Tco_0383844, partial [Tanacetum coccineum]